MYCNDTVQCTRFPPEMQPKQPGSRCFRAVQAIEKVRWTFSTAFTMPRFFVCFAVQKAAAARRKRLLPQAFCRHSIQHEGGSPTPSRLYGLQATLACKPCRFLETASLFPPPAALRRFPPRTPPAKLNAFSPTEVFRQVGRPDFRQAAF